MENQDTPPEKDWSISKIMRWGLGAIALLYLLFFILLETGLFKHYASQEIAAFGDAFGSINSLFSALAFLVIAVSLYLQNREFRLQREELELQRKEFKAAREEQASLQEAQRKEMQLTRELHVRSNFEGRLMFLLKNLEQATEEVNGGFNQNPNRTSVERNHYFDNFLAEIICIQISETDGFLLLPPENADYLIALFKYYHLEGMQVNNPEKPDTINRNFPNNDFSIFLIAKVHDKRRQEYYQSFMIFLSVIDALQKEYDAWTQAGFGTQDEIKRHFESYVYLLKSSIPHSAFVYFMYVRSLPNGEIPYSIIHKMLLERFGTTDYLRKEHWNSLLEAPSEKEKQIN